MIIRIIWILTGINVIALVLVIGFFIASTEGRNVDTMEKGWMNIFFALGFITILLSVIPLRISHSPVSIFIAGFFAVLPLAIATGIFISKKIPAKKNNRQSLAEFYFKNAKQRSIAAAIEQNDTALLAKLIEDQDLNVQGNRVWDGDGLTYLQFAIRLRRDKSTFPFVDEINQSMIRLLVQHGATTTPALSEAVICLPADIVTLLLDHGANPNTHGFVSNNPLLFESIGTARAKNDMGILLIKKGADVNAKNDYEQTPLMYAAQNSGTSANWTDCWRVILYLLRDAKADYTYIRSDGRNFITIIREIRKEAADKKINMPKDFLAVVEWLNAKQVDTTP